MPLFNSPLRELVGVRVRVRTPRRGPVIVRSNYHKLKLWVSASFQIFKRLTLR